MERNKKEKSPDGGYERSGGCGLQGPRIKIYLQYGNLSNSGQLNDLLHNAQPEEICGLGAQSHIRVSVDVPEYASDIGRADPYGI